MQRIIFPVLMISLFLSGNAPALAGGDIYVGGPWGTKITSLPKTISAPGSYYLGSDLSYSGSGDGITITPGINHVTLDLMGFTLNGSGSGRYGIRLIGSKNVEIRNGTVTGWGWGISENNDGRLHRIINVRAVGNTCGIFLGGQGHLVKGCEATATGLYCAISIVSQGTVSGCKVKFVDGCGIWNDGGIISDNVVLSTGTGSSRYGIDTQVWPTLIKGNKVSGCAYGIRGQGIGLNVIGNTVDAASGTTGFYLTDDYSTLLDQNTVTGAGYHYNAAYTKIVKRNNF